MLIYSGRGQLHICLLQITKAFLQPLCTCHCHWMGVETSAGVVHIFIPQLQAHRFHFDFAGRDTLLPTRFPSNCFHTIKGKACQCLYTQQQIKSHTAVVTRRQVKRRLQKHLQQRDGHNGRGGDVMCFYGWLRSFLMTGAQQTDSAVCAAIMTLKFSFPNSNGQMCF